MPRWRSSLALLERLGAHEACVQSFASASRTSRVHDLTAAVPDFLAPALCTTPSSTRCYSAVSPHIALQPSSQQDAEHETKVSSYFDANVPTEAELHGATSTSTTNSSDANIAYIREQFKDATSQDTLATTAEKLFHSASLAAERRYSRRPSPSHKPAPFPPIDLNEAFLLCLLKSASTLTEGKERIHKLVTQYLCMVHARVRAHRFSSLFLFQLANQAASTWATSVLNQLLVIVEQRLSHESAKHDVRTSGNANSTAAATSPDRLPAMSCTLHDLMRGFLQTGQFRKVLRCFELLEAHSLPATIFHYQLKLIAVLRICTSNFTEAQHIDVEQHSQQMQAEILRIKASMEADDTALDDTFLATIVFGLSAPLVSPQARRTSATQASNALRLVRSIFDRFAVAGQTQSLQDMPRFLTALIQAEIDALARDANGRSKHGREAVVRIQRLMWRLESASSSISSGAVGRIGERRVTESDLSIFSLRLRMATVTGDIDYGLAHLRQILKIQPLSEAERADQLRELIVKQRSSVILLFSAAIEHRVSIAGKDAALEVLQTAFSPKWFDRLWTGTYFPSNPLSGFDAKEYNPDMMVVRLWKRWFCAWSIDYWFRGYRAPSNEGDHRGVSIGNLGQVAAQDGHGKWAKRTFNGKHPWTSLKRGLQLLNRVFDLYEARQYANVTNAKRPNGVSIPEHGEDSALDSRTPSVFPRFEKLFNERNAFNNMVKVTLRGRRPGRGETMATYVDKRLALLTRALTRIHAPARIWEQFESFLIHHLALIDNQLLPTEAIRPSIDQIQLRKRAALLRDQTLLSLWQQAKLTENKQPLNHDAKPAAEELPPETGSIFVLRQMLEHRAQKYKSSKAKTNATTKPRPAFT